MALFSTIPGLFNTTSNLNFISGMSFALERLTKSLSPTLSGNKLSAGLINNGIADTLMPGNASVIDFCRCLPTTATVPKFYLKTYSLLKSTDLTLIESMFPLEKALLMELSNSFIPR